MKKLCFGTYATILKRCMAKRVTQKRLCGTMLLSVAPTYDISGEDGTVSDLILGKKKSILHSTDTAPGAVLMLSQITLSKTFSRCWIVIRET